MTGNQTTNVKRDGGKAGQNVLMTVTVIDPIYCMEDGGRHRIREVCTRFATWHVGSMMQAEVTVFR